MKTELLTALLELLRGRTGKWDVIKDAITDTGQTVRFIAIIVAMTLSTAAVAFLAEILVRR
jgi:hypothetical protein